MKVCQLSFDKLGLDKPILSTLEAQGYEQPTPIQTQAIPFILQGRDVVGLAQTGTGKTAAFTLPLLQRLSNNKTKVKPGTARVLILSPTRELAAQIHKSVRDYGRKLSLRSACVVGGVAVRPQRKALEGGVDVLVATPGRLEDLIQQRAVRLSEVETIVLDEADQMLDIGFMPAILRILKLLPAKRQALLFSATMPREIRDLSERHLHKPEKVSVAAVSSTVEKVEQNVMHVPHDQKLIAMIELLRAQKDGERVIVFTRTKRGADKVARRLNAEDISAAAIHGNKTQGQRQRALDGFRKGTCKVLIATDIAARGIDVPGVGLVINYELPNIPESYVHRIGRTARAGASGVAVSFCARDERSYLRDIERLIRQQLNVLPAPKIDQDMLRAFAAKAPQREPERADPRDKRQRRPANRSGKSERSGRPDRSKKSEWTPMAKSGEKPARGRKPADASTSADGGKGKWALKSEGETRPNRNAKPGGAAKSKKWRSKSEGDARPAHSGKPSSAGKSEWRSKSSDDARPGRGGKPSGSGKTNRGGPKSSGGAPFRGKSNRGPSQASSRRQPATAN